MDYQLLTKVLLEQQLLNRRESLHRLLLVCLDLLGDRLMLLNQISGHYDLIKLLWLLVQFKLVDHLLCDVDDSRIEYLNEAAS